MIFEFNQTGKKEKKKKNLLALVGMLGLQDLKQSDLQSPHIAFLICRLLLSVQWKLCLPLHQTCLPCSYFTLLFHEVETVYKHDPFTIRNDISPVIFFLKISAKFCFYVLWPDICLFLHTTSNLEWSHHPVVQVFVCLFVLGIRYFRMMIF